MRIALSSIHPRPLSGQIESLVGLAQTLQAEGHAVTIVSAFPSEQLLGADRIHLSTRHGLLIREPFRIVNILATLVRIAPQVDLIQLNLPTPAFSMFADLLQMLVRVPLIVCYEAHLVDGRDLRRLGLVRASPSFYLPRFVVNNRLVARLTLHRAAHYVVSSEYQKAELAALGYRPERISLLLNLLPQDKLARPSHEQARARLQLPNTTVICYFGHYNHVKGVDVLLRAFAQLARRQPGVQLALAWSGLGTRRPADQWLGQPELAGRVLQLGQVDVPNLIAASDVIVLPYRLTIGQAAYPGALLEALVGNVPVVTTDLPLLRELTLGGRTALLVPPEDPTALADGLERLIESPELRQNMLEAQRVWAQSAIPANVVKGYERLYRQIGARKTRVLFSADGRE